MPRLWTNSHLSFAALLLLMPGSQAWAQKSPAPPAGPAGGIGSATTGRGTTNPNSINNGRTNPNSNTSGNNQNAIFLSGRVMFDNGMPSERDIRIERVCGGNVHVEGHPDSKGRFSFQLGQNIGMDMDASDNNMGGMNRGAGNANPNFGGNSGIPGRGSMGLSNCELRASYPGYRSDIVQLATRQSMDSPDVGTIVLHRLGNVQGSTISVTTELAPKDARKAYEKGMQLAQRGKLDEAQQHLANATDVYPKYAVAWFALGQLQQRQGHTNEAQKSYQAAIRADSHYVSPYDELGHIAAQEGRWEDAAQFSKQAISLNPVEFPAAFWYNALANYNLKHPGEAEKSTADLLKLDTRHNYPEAENLMAQLLVNDRKYPEAATHLRNYLQLVPNAKNADALKQMLLRIEAASSAPPANAKVPPARP